METPQLQKKLTLVITGMHRSGTSLTVSLLQSAGVNIGEKFEAPNAANAKGYFENLDFVRFHEEILYSQGIRKEGWTLEKKIQVQEQYLDRARQLVQENSSKPIWGWKDPRTTLFLDFWADFIPDSNFIFVYRAPWEVVDSLYRRSNMGDDVFDFNPNFAIKLWVNYNQSLLNFYNQATERCILLSLVDIVHEPGILVEAIKEKFGVTLSLPDQDIYDSSLLHSQVSNTHRPSLIKQYFPEALNLYDELNAKALLLKNSSKSIYSEQPPLGHYEAWVLQDWLNVRRLEKQKSTLQNQLQQSQAEWERLQSQLQNTEAEYLRLQSHAKQLETEYENLQSHAKQLETEYENLQSHAKQLETEYKNWQSHLQQIEKEYRGLQSHAQHIQLEVERLHSQLDQTRLELEQIQLELERSQGKITAMESSKFWKLRTAWFRLKKFMGIKGD